MYMLIIRWLLSSVVLLLVSQLLPGFQVDSWAYALVIALVLGLINITLKPILMLLTLPINLLTLGLFTFIINAALLQLAAAILEGFSIDNFGTALLAALLMALFGWGINAIGRSVEEGSQAGN